MAEVFKAKSFGVEGFERIVAVKRILPTMAEDDEFITMFVDEARIASHLTHQNIVQIYELGKTDNIYYISMEYVAGRDLRQILDHHKRLKRPMEVAKACYIASRVCEALEYAHKKKDPAGKDLKIIHRDVSPQNVIISFEGEVKLCDFGIAKAVSRVSRTQVGVLKGKFAYMSPEQVRGQPTDRRSDLFALGVIFYEMLTGERLFLGESDYSTLEAVRNARVPAPTQYNGRIPATLEKIMMRLLARDPKDRYQWASEVHEDLLDHLVADGKIYHGRHLRGWMQEVYARDIEIENAKLEEFMRLKLPDSLKLDDDDKSEDEPSPSPIVMQMADEAKGERPKSADPALHVMTNVGGPETADPERAESTASGQANLASIESLDGDHLAETHPRREDDVSADRLESSPAKPPAPTSLEAGRARSPAGASQAAQVASASPVSHIFGTPQLDGEKSPDHDEAFVRPAEPRTPPVDDAGGSHPVIGTSMADETIVPDQAFEVNQTLLSEEEPADDGERTQCDLMTEAGVSDRNDTLFDPENTEHASEETLASDTYLQKQIRAAQSELKKTLGALGPLDSVETLDAGEDSKEYVSPYVFDPSEGSITGEEELPPTSEQSPVSRADLDDKTSISPFPGDEATPSEEFDAETAVAPKAQPPTPPPSSIADVGIEFVEYEPKKERASEQQKSGEISRGGSAARPASRRPKKSPRPGEKIAPESNRAAPALGSKRRIWEVTPDEVKLSARTPAPPIEEVRPPPPPPPASARNGVSHAPHTPVAPVESLAPRPMPAEDMHHPWMPPLPIFGQRSIASSIVLRDPRILMLIAAAVGMLAIALLVTLILTRGSPGASLHIVTEPTKTVEVRLDGKVIATETPVEASALKLGTHTVELRAPGYHAYTQVVQIAEAKPHTMVVPLEAMPEPPPRMDQKSVTIDPNESEEIAPPKRPTEDDAAEKADPGRSAGEAEPTPPKPEKKVETRAERRGEPRLVGTKEERPLPKPAPATSAESGPGSLAAKPKPEKLEKAEKVEKAEKTAPPKEDEGYLVVTTKPMGVGVIIDGKKTNLRTPIRHPYPLSPGKHILTFEMDDGQKYNFDVQIAAGETKKVSKLLR
jgi:serine/threonine protein kinase